MKVLFLDIDGVLNSTRSCIAFHGYPFGLGAESLEMFDPIAVNMIRGLCAHAGVSVVVSSAWRITHHWDDIGKSLDLPTIDATPQLMGPRGNEIQAWLDAHPDVTQYAIVDDDADMLNSQLPRFVKTDINEGLSFSNFQHLCELFGVHVDACTPQRIRTGKSVKLVWTDQ